MTQPSTTTQITTAERIARLTATRDSLLATAEDPHLPLTRERAVRMARYVTTQIAALAGAEVCGMCQVDIATETVDVPGQGEMPVDLMCGAWTRALL